MRDELETDADYSEALERLGKSKGAYGRFALAALGSIPWVGGLIAASAALQGDRAQGKVNQALEQWLTEHEARIRELFEGLQAVAKRVDSFGAEAQARMQDESYLTVVRKGFRVWDKCETKSKRNYVLLLLTNAAGTNLVEDDIVRLFLDWIDRYHDAHFGIIRAVFKNPGITRLGIWRTMGRDGTLPAENSSDADLFRMLIHDLSTGRVIRQERDFDGIGWLKKSMRGRHKAPPSPYTKSSFDNEEPYELTELGKEFVRYVLQEAVTRLGSHAHDQ